MHHGMRQSITLIGITLLEILLVLAVMGVIAVLSVRYYRSVTNAQLARALTIHLQKVADVADKLAADTHSYKDITFGDFKELVGEQAFKLPWGGSMTFVKAEEKQLQFTFNVPHGICELVMPGLASTKRWGSQFHALDTLPDYNCGAFSKGDDIVLYIAPTQ